MDPSVPVRISIPTLHVSSTIIRLGLNSDGTMQVPSGPGKAGWYVHGPTPGELGPAVIAAHVTWNRTPDVFFRLGAVKPGDQVKVSRRDGSTAIFEITKVAQYAKKDFPTKAVYGTTDHAALRLITCGGVFDGENNRYLDNVVAYAELRSTHSCAGGC